MVIMVIVQYCNNKSRLKNDMEYGEENEAERNGI